MTTAQFAAGLIESESLHIKAVLRTNRNPCIPHNSAIRYEPDL